MRGPAIRAVCGPFALWLCAAGTSACVPTAYDKNLVEQLDREVLAHRQRNETLTRMLEACDDGETAPSPVYPELLQAFAGTEIKVVRDGPLAVVVVPGELLFSPGSTSVRDEAAMVVDLLATAMTSHPDTHVWIVGHTDDSPLQGSLKRRYGSNWELSSARASAFMAALVGGFGLDEARFTVAGRGPTDPVADNDTPEGRAQNRRIVVVLGPPESYR